MNSMMMLCALLVPLFVGTPVKHKPQAPKTPPPKSAPEKPKPAPEKPKPAPDKPKAATNVCDMKTVVPAFWCAHDKKLWESKDLVSNAVYYTCAADGVVQAAAGKCPKCSKDLEKKTSDADVCKVCFQKPEKAEGCQKTYWECDTCKKPMMAAGNCDKCKTPLVQHTSLALIEYKCEKCGHKSLHPGNCTAASAKDCPNFGKPLTRTCSESGKPPHVAHAA